MLKRSVTMDSFMVAPRAITAHLAAATTFMVEARNHFLVIQQQLLQMDTI